MKIDFKQISNFKIKSGFTLAEVFSVHPKGSRNQAFTLAEVLITLGIIGVVAAMTLPTLIQKHQKRVLEKQFIKAYSLVSQAAKKAEADLGFTPECFYSNINPEDNKFGDCEIFGNAIIKNLKVIKTCTNNAIAGGCIADIAGSEALLSQKYPDMSEEEINQATIDCNGWRKNRIELKTAFVVADGVTLINYMSNISYFSPEIFAIDINGLKGPNKWGHDIFVFTTIGNFNGGLKLNAPTGGCQLIEPGGVTTRTMLNSIYK